MFRIKPFFVLLLFASLIPASLVVAGEVAVAPDPKVPQGENLQVPEGWLVRPDKPNPDLVVSSDADTADIFFVNMTPGWHLTTGPAAILYHPASVAEGSFTTSTVIHFFDPGERQREAFGLFLGGRDLGGDDQTYLYFLIRNTGEFLIKRRSGADTHLVQDWAASPAIVRFSGESESSGDSESSAESVQNELTVAVSAAELLFTINGTEVARTPRASLPTDGVVGLRVNHGINLHVSDLKISSR